MAWTENVGGRQTKMADEGASGEKWLKSDNNIQCVRAGVGDVIHNQLTRRNENNYNSNFYDFYEFNHNSSDEPFDDPLQKKFAGSRCQKWQQMV